MIFSLSVIPDGSGDLLVGVRETDGEQTELRLLGENGKPVPFTCTDVLGEGGDPLLSCETFGMEPFGSVFVRIKK